MSAKTLTIAPPMPQSPEERDEAILSFMREQLSVVTEFSPELNEISARFSHSYRNYVSCVELMDRADAAIRDVNAFCDSIYEKSTDKTKNITPVETSSAP